MTILSKLVLTNEQNEVKEVILSDKSCVVNACPGAGKTTLSLVITQLYNKKTLILTFSSKLKDETREKVRNNNIKKQSRMLQDELYDSSDDDDIICYRCGRPGHKSNECYAQKHKKGYWLD